MPDCNTPDNTGAFASSGCADDSGLFTVPIGDIFASASSCGCVDPEPTPWLVEPTCSGGTSGGTINLDNYVKKFGDPQDILGLINFTISPTVPDAVAVDEAASWGQVQNYSYSKVQSDARYAPITGGGYAQLVGGNNFTGGYNTFAGPSANDWITKWYRYGTTTMIGGFIQNPNLSGRFILYNSSGGIMVDIDGSPSTGSIFTNGINAGGLAIPTFTTNGGIVTTNASGIFQQTGVTITGTAVSAGQYNSLGGDGSSGSLLGSGLTLNSNLFRDDGPGFGFRMANTSNVMYLAFRPSGIFGAADYSASVTSLAYIQKAYADATYISSSNIPAGSINYVQRVISAGVLGNSLIQDNGTNVRIGTSYLGSVGAMSIQKSNADIFGYGTLYLQNTFNNFTTNPTVSYPVLTLERSGLTGTSNSSLAEFGLSRYSTSGGTDANSQLDIILRPAQAGTRMTVISFRSDGTGTMANGSLSVTSSTSYGVYSRGRNNTNGITNIAGIRAVNDAATAGRAAGLQVAFGDISRVSAGYGAILTNATTGAAHAVIGISSGGSLQTVYQAYVTGQQQFGRNVSASSAFYIGPTVFSSAVSGIARGINNAITLYATANNDSLVGLDLGASFSSSGAIASTSTLVGGTGYVSGTYTGVSLQGGTGSGAEATLVVTGGVVTGVTITATGGGFTVADVLTADPSFDGTGAGTGFSITVATISSYTGVTTYSLRSLGTGLGLFNGAFSFGNSISLTNATSNNITFGTGAAAPSFTTPSIGEKLVLSGGISSIATNYAIGIEPNAMWFGIGNNSNTRSFRWYGGTTLQMTLTGNGILNVAGISASSVVVTDASKNLIASATTSTELTYVSGVTSAIQTQLNGKMTNPMTTVGDIIRGGTSGTPTRLAIGSTNDVLTVVGGVPTWQALGSTGWTTNTTQTGLTGDKSTSGTITAGALVAANGTFSTSVGIGTANSLFFDAGPSLTDIRYLNTAAAQYVARFTRTAGSEKFNFGPTATPNWLEINSGGITALTSVRASDSAGTTWTQLVANGIQSSFIGGMQNITFQNAATIYQALGHQFKVTTDVANVYQDGLILTSNGAGLALAKFNSAIVSSASGTALQINRGVNVSVASTGVIFGFQSVISHSSGQYTGILISPSYSQTGTAAADDLVITRTETSLGSGAQNFILCSVSGVGTKFAVNNLGHIRGVLPAYSSGTFINTVYNSTNNRFETRLLGRLNGYTVSTLPAGTVGDTAYVTDATAPTYLGVLIGGGSITCPVFYNGTAWVSN